ncbi:MAG: enoyl-CoA hydratase-related protein [Acidobacteriaceae bacterium]
MTERRYETISVTSQGSARTITLNRPERRNAMTSTMQDELISAMEAAAVENDCGVLVITGAGEAFCAGLDLEQLKSVVDQSPAEHKIDAERVARLFRTLYELPLPTIAAVNGAAIAGGTGLATLCDFTLAVPEAKFGYTEVRIGFVPALVSAFLALQMGDKRARAVLLTGRLFTAEEAHGWGLVSEVVARENLLERSRELAKLLLCNSLQAMAETKRLLAEQNRVWLDGAIEAALRANAGARQTADFREGVTAFLEKRKAVWGRRIG